MTGKYDMTLYNNKVHYHLTIKRNITIFQGDSATGKSELIRLLSAHNANPTSSGITLICEKECTVLTEGNWELYLREYQNHIFFIDEGNSFLRTKKFAEAVKGSDNYYVIIYRESLPQLPYSIDEIFGLRENTGSKYRNPKRVYNEMYQIYGELPSVNPSPEVIIVEDSNSGYEFFREIFGEKCISAHGKSNVKRLLLENSKNSIIAIVDGAAFGSEMGECMEIALFTDAPIAIFTPESFEYLILKSGLFQVPKAVLDETYEYADSKQYFSWEEFYHSFLVEISQNEVYQYSKRKLNAFYKTEGSIEKIRDILPDSIKRLI